MNDYIRRPVMLREVAGLVIQQDADRALVNGRDASITVNPCSARRSCPSRVSRDA